MNEEQRIIICETSVSRITTPLSTSLQGYRSYLLLSRQITDHLDATTFMTQPNRLAEQVWIIASLQRLTFVQTDSGGVPDLAAWCSWQLLSILQLGALNMGALSGLGQIWLASAQPTLARIHRSKGSCSTAGSGNQGSSGGGGGKKATEARQEAERGAGNADYVEARGLVQPACEYLERAVRAAGSQRTLSADFACHGESTMTRLWL